MKIEQLAKGLFFLGVVLWLAAYICGQIVDPDLWWHIVIGRWILSQQQIPHVDLWTQFGSGQVFRAYSWLIEILFAQVDAYGPRALFALKYFIAVLFSGSVFLMLKKLSKDSFFALLFSVPVVLGCYNHFTLRPQSLIWVYFAGLLAVTLKQEKFSKKDLGYIFILMMLWANTHLSAALPLLAVATGMLAKNNLSVTLKAVGAGFLGTLCTPYLGGEWITFISKVNHPFTNSSIAEFQAATINQYPTVFLFLMVLVGLWFLHLRPKALPVVLPLSVGAFVLGGLAINKFLPLALIFVAAVLATIWREQSRSMVQETGIPQAIAKFSEGLNGLPNSAFVLLGILLSLVAGGQVFMTSKKPIAGQIVALEAMNFFQNNKLPLPVLNTFGDGGYVLYRFADASGIPGYKVPIDGRTNITPRDVQEKHHAAFSGYTTWRDYIDLVHPETILWRTASPLTALAIASKEWCLVYQHEDLERGHSLFIKREMWTKSYSQLKSINCNTLTAL